MPRYQLDYSPASFSLPTMESGSIRIPLTITNTAEILEQLKSCKLKGYLLAQCINDLTDGEIYVEDHPDPKYITVSTDGGNGPDHTVSLAVWKKAIQKLARLYAE